MAYINISYTLVRVLLWIGTVWTTLARDPPTVTITPQYCITSGNSALSFIEPLDEKFISQITSQVYPPVNKNLEIDCTMNANSKCLSLWENDYWKLQNSIDDQMTEPLTDWRWEALPQYRIEDKKVHQISAIVGDFRIWFSLRTEKDANVFLCNGKQFAKSDCYSIVLGGSKGESYLKICHANKCSDNLAVKKHDDTEEILSDNKWTHLEIKRIGDTFTVSSGTTKQIKILEYTNKTPLYSTDKIKITHISVQSKQSNGLWKLHSYTYIYSREKFNSQLGPQNIYIEKDSHCISMFIRTCTQCDLFFSLWCNGIVSIKIDNNTFNTMDEKWTEIKLLFHSSEDRNDCKLYANAKTKDDNYDSQMFWAIDNVRKCSAIEYRYLKSSGKQDKCQLKCQLINNGNVVELNEENEVISDIDTYQSSSTIGSQGIPCKLIEGILNCKKFKYCEIVGNNNKVCHCTSGHHTNECNECSSGRYGHGCLKTCSQCEEENCYPLSGTCTKDYSCASGFKNSGITWPECIPLDGIFKEGPAILQTDLTSCMIEVDPNSFLKGTTPRSKVFYRIEYTEIEEAVSKESAWSNTSTKYGLGNGAKEEIVIKNLKPDTTYSVRAVVFSKPPGFQGDLIMESKFRTKCHPIKERDIILVKSTDTTADININQSEESCKISNYKYVILNNSKKEFHPKRATNFLKITNLQPCKTYQLILSHVYYQEEVRKNVNTKERAASAVINPEVNVGNLTKAVLTWKEPTEQNCKIIYYHVTYRRTKGLACEQDINNNQEITKQVDSNYTNQKNEYTFVLKDLVPYSNYTISIAGITGPISGEKSILNFKTPQADVLTEKEIQNVQNVQLVPTNSTISLNISNVNCDTQRGPIYLNFVVTCQTNWCYSKIHYQSTFKLTTPIVLKDLEPYVNYRIVMRISRWNASDWNSSEIVLNKTITTEPSAPHQIGSLTWQPKDDNSIELRWSPPKPPTGVLNMYKIKYSDKWPLTDIDKYVEVKPALCRLWSEYHCATIKEGITSGTSYFIEIWATNESPHEFVNVTGTEIYVKASEGVPGPPTNLSADWLADNTLNVSWKQPFITNGLVKEFRIALMNVESTNRLSMGTEISYNLTSEDDYKLVYSYQINKTGLRGCSKDRMHITTYNQRYNSTPAVMELDWSPPPIPNTKEILVTSTTNHTITIQIPTLKKEHKTAYLTTAYLFVSDKAYDDDELNRIDTYLRKSQVNKFTIRTSELVFETEGHNLPERFHIGNESANRYKNKFIKHLNNPPLVDGQDYGIYLFYVNECYGKVEINRLKTNATTGNPKLKNAARGGTNSPNNGLYALFLLLFLIPLVAYILYRKRKTGLAGIALRSLKQSSGEENIDRMPLTRRPPVVRSTKPIVEPKAMPRERTRSVLKTTHSKPIRIGEYEVYVKAAIQSGELEKQHDLFPRGQTKSWNYGALKINKTKNRYNNLIAYDHSRVKLKKIPGDEYSDYINASFIDGYKSPKAYIATQGPKATTLYDFWRMIWQYKVQHIVMLANLVEGGKKKVEKYWPDINGYKDIKEIRVQHVSSKVFADYEYRVFNVYNRGTQRQVEQLHFTSWPDHGIPLYCQSLVPFLQRILKIPSGSTHPVVVHCSAGVGRTGTIILCDISLRMAASEGAVDFLANLEHLRTQRPNMVDNIEQYKLAHLVVLECLFGMRTSIDCNDNMEKTVNALIESDGIRQYMLYLEETEWQDKAMDTVWEFDDNCPIYPEKNRFKHIVPEQHHRVCLPRYPTDDERSSYINAVRVDGFRSPGRFIVTQQPMPNTLGDFWRLVDERRCTVILSLNKVNLNDVTSCQFWPNNGKELRPVDYLTVRHVKTTTTCDGYSIFNVHLFREGEDDMLPITIISMENWKPRDPLPHDIRQFLTFWEESDVLSRNADTVIITCYDGATASGVYIATSFVIEKIKLEHICDVCLAVRNIRHNRSQFVTSKEQFEFLYRISMIYIESFQSYANFT